MTMFAKIFMKSNNERRFQRKEGLKLESNKEKDPIICYECKKSRHIKVVPNERKMGQTNKNIRPIDEDSFDDEEQEVTNIFLMTIEDSEVTSNSSSLIPYSFDKLQDAYDELGLEFEVMVSKHKKKKNSKLKVENDLLSKTNHEHEEKVNRLQTITDDF
ncbi:zf-CCHC domain-containing protein [Gossypium australe]|uniref:Zf-CCHC domain-containing protein n=1 Tax=Gossypium australe TaxID=47621 RepID=A0A5B6W8G4_9ROSI|nr:zf-CCHC domain-containing protein [Gossypium australe]